MLTSMYVKVRVFFADFRLRAKEEGGATAAEYALLVSLIAVVLVVGAFLLGNAVNDRLTSTANCINTANGAPC